MAVSNEETIRLGHLGFRIMDVVWDVGEATVHDVRDALTSGRSPTYSTILTMMRKLEEKGYLRHEVRSRAYVYSATITRSNARRSVVAELLDRAFDGSPQKLLAALVSQDRITEEELDEVRKLIPRKGDSDGQSS